MRTLWIGTNWKMNKTFDESETYARSLRKYLEIHSPDLHVFIIPPYTVLHEVCDLLKGTPVRVGAQNMHWEPKGAFTGEISAPMIKDCGAQLIELGHSERREQFGETDFTVNKKVLSALQHGLQPLVCVGETAVEKEFGVTQEYVSRQVKIALQHVLPQQMEKVLIAYEPVWAIGEKGIAADSDYANAVQSTIRNVVVELFGNAIGKRLPILYGGSVNIENAPHFVQKPDIDGLFIGRAAWDVDSFIQIIEVIQKKVQIRET
ncbi:MAG: triose-phosphate isomerase [Thermodesulfobacteriota bacterium]